MTHVLRFLLHTNEWCFEKTIFYAKGLKRTQFERDFLYDPHSDSVNDVLCENLKLEVRRSHFFCYDILLTKLFELF